MGHIANKRGDELNWLRLFEILGFILVWVALFAFLNFTVVEKYSLTEIYPIYVIWGLGMLLMFVMRYSRKRQYSI